MEPIRLATLAPGHFHAALVQKRRLPGLDRRCAVYAPDDADLRLHLQRIAGFGLDWDVDVHAGADFLDRLERDDVGTAVVLSGRNRPKLDLMRRAVAKGLHVLADKPWIVVPEDYEPLVALLREADRRGVVIADAMTERYEATSRRQNALIRDYSRFGDWQTGTPEEPALEFESVHYLKKTVAGSPLLRPWWWFDSGIAGEAIADVGTHLADLAIWFLAPETAIDPHRDVQFLEARRWPLLLTREQFRDVTGLEAFPQELEPYVNAGMLRYAGNNAVSFALRGVHVRLIVRWEFDSPGGDTHRAIARGTNGTIEVRQEPGRAPGLFLNGEHLPIPDAERTSHEDHFAEVMDAFLRRVEDPSAAPEWERANELAKYFITTQALRWMS